MRISQRPLSDYLDRARGQSLRVTRPLTNTQTMGLGGGS